MTRRDGLSDTERLQLDFWTAFIRFCEESRASLKLGTPQGEHYHEMPLGRPGFKLSLKASPKKDEVGCSIYIRHAQAKHAFAGLERDKVDIESAVTARLQWQPMRKVGACRISQIQHANLEARDTWPKLFGWLKERAEAFHRVFSPRIKALDLEEETPTVDGGETRERSEE